MKKAAVKRSDVKIDEELKHEVQSEATRLRVFDYEITEEALRRFLPLAKLLPDKSGSGAFGNINLPGTVITGNFDIGSKHEIKSGDIGESESPWVGKLLRILRSMTQFAKSIKENLDGFELGLDVMEELAKLKASVHERNALVHATPKGDDLAAGIERTRKNADRLGRTLAGTPEIGKTVQKKEA